MNGLEIAVIGASCRFPEANNIEKLWDVFVKGKNCITEFTIEELIANGVPEHIAKCDHFIKKKAALHEATQFDGKFLVLSPTEQFYLLAS